MLNAILSAFLVVGATDDPAPAQAEKVAGQAAELVPDPSYTPREGDRITIVADATPGFSRASLFDEYDRASDADEQAVLRAMIDKGQVVALEGKAPVLVIRNLDPAGAREPGRHYPVEVRILGGPRAGETWFVAESSLVRLVPKVVHPPLENGAYATIAPPRTVAYLRWEAFDPAARSLDKAAAEEAFRLDAGTRVVVLESRGAAVRVRVLKTSKLSGREGVVDRAALRPIVRPSRPAKPEPPSERE